MKLLKVFDVCEFPEELRDKIYERIQDGEGSCSWYPGDGYFKLLSKVKDISKIHFYGNDTMETPNLCVYEEGDDPVGDFLMKEFNVKLYEEVLIK